MWPSTGDLEPGSSVQNLYTLRVSLGGPIDDLEETVVAVTGRLSLFHLMIDKDPRHRIRLSLTLETPDLWQAILLTMNAITNTGYTPVALTAEPAIDHETDVWRSSTSATCSAEC